MPLTVDIEAFRRGFLRAGGPIGTQDEAIRAGLEECGITALLSEAADLRMLFTVQWERMTAATALWRAEDPEARACVMPDLGALLEWLMARGGPGKDPSP